MAMAAIVSMSGCTTLVSGTTQTVTLNSEPTGAACTVERNGRLVSQFITPGSVTVDKSRNALTITCRKPGYAPVIGTDPSSIEGWIFGNVLIGGLTGAGLDLLTDADESYHQNVIVRMHRLVPAPYAAPLPPSALNTLPSAPPAGPGS